MVTSSRVFLLGGGTGSAAINTIHSAVIQADGTLGAFTSAGTLPTVLAHSSVVVTSSRVFLLGGHNGSAAINTIFSATINSDGTLSEFTSAGTLPTVLAHSSVVVTSSRVFLLGGWVGSGNITNAIFSATINSDGTLSAFTSAGTLPSILYTSSVVVTSSRVFLLGGGFRDTPATVNAVDTIFSATINADGTLSTFTSAGTLPSVLFHSTAVITSSRVFLLGGHVGNLTLNTIFSAPLVGGSGLNNYSPFYTNFSIASTTPSGSSTATHFTLPNAILKEQLLPGNFVYIKT